MLSPEYAKIVDEIFNIWCVAMFFLIGGGSIFLLIKALWLAAGEAYGDYIKVTNSEEKKEIKRFADEMYGVYFTHADWYQIPRDAFIVIYKIKD